MLGEFFGVTGAMSALLEFNRSRLIRLSSIINNPMDVKRLTKFKTELGYLCDYLDNTVKTEYTVPAAKKLERQIELVEKGDVAGAKKYRLDISGMSQAERESLVKSLEDQISVLVMGIDKPMRVRPSFRKYNSNEIVTLGEHDILVLEHFKKYYRRTLENYINVIEVKSFYEKTAFGEKLYMIATKSPWRLMSVVVDLFSTPGANKERLKEACLEGVDVLRAHFSTEGKGREASHGKTLVDLMEMDLSLILLEDFGEMNEERERIARQFAEDRYEFISVMREIVDYGLLPGNYVYDLIDMYYKLYRLDYDAEYICSLIFPEGSGIRLSLREIDEIYARLASVGFVYLHRVNSKLMVESLKKLSFSSESKTEIDPHADINGITFARVADNIENLCKAMVPAGTNIEGVEV